MNCLELFSGTGSFSWVARSRGHVTFTVDVDPRFGPDLVHDLLLPPPPLLVDRIGWADVIWMSPPCTSFSIASRDIHWTKSREPRTQTAIDGYRLLRFCKRLAYECIESNKTFFIENPVGRARWFLPTKWRRTVWYCRYGYPTAKPTDIWNNLDGWIGKKCHANNPFCHHAKSPRGSHKGIEGMSCAKVRSVIPPALINELFDHLEYNPSWQF